jgi:hypothetical protein
MVGKYSKPDIALKGHFKKAKSVAILQKTCQNGVFPAHFWFFHALIQGRL